MSTEEKRELAAKVVRLTLREPTVTGAGITEEYKASIRNRFYDEQTALRVKHFSVEQLRALLDFYSSDMGASILQSQNKMIDDMGIRLVSGEEGAEEQQP